MAASIMAAWRNSQNESVNNRRNVAVAAAASKWHQWRRNEIMKISETSAAKRKKAKAESL
jgi:hypothetical protein